MGEMYEDEDSARGVVDVEMTIIREKFAQRLYLSPLVGLATSCRPEAIPTA